MHEIFIYKYDEADVLTMEVVTKNVRTHSLMSDNPESWRRIINVIREELNRLIEKKNELDR